MIEINDIPFQVLLDVSDSELRQYPIGKPWVRGRPKGTLSCGSYTGRLRDHALNFKIIFISIKPDVGVS
jgi:hypothetical protein